MTAVAIIRIVIIVLSGLAGLVGLFYLLRGLLLRGASSREPYNVGRLEARRGTRMDLLSGLAALLVGAALLFVFLALPADMETGPQTDTGDSLMPATTDTPPSSSPVDTPETEDTPSPTGTPTAAPSPTNPPPSPTNTPPPTATITPAPRTATVSSGVGVWLRREPNAEGEQIEWLLQGTVVTVLEATAVDDEFQWQQVLTADGIVGWVAVPFIEYNDP